MTAGRELELERLREAFRAEAGTDGGTDVDAERVWRAVAGELPPEERREVIDLVALDAGYAEAWRLAVELQKSMRETPGRSEPAAAPGEVVPFAKRRAGLVQQSWLAAAAVLVAVVGVGTLVARLASTPEPVYREPGSAAIASLVGEVALPRSRCLLRWSELPAGTRYQVRVTTSELDVLADVPGLEVNEYLVPEDRLAGLAAGATIYWQVEARLPEGSVVASETFVNQLE